MQTLAADFLAICVIGLLVGTLLYFLPPHVPFKEHWLVWSAICTAVLSILAVHSWKDDPVVSSLRDWTHLCLGGWAFSIVLFLIACWIRDVPVSEALNLPVSLWADTDSYWLDRPFWYAAIAGPGLTIMATASLIRTTALRLGNIPVEPRPARRTISYRSPLWQEHEPGWSSFWFRVLVLPIFGIVLGHGTWIAYAVLDGEWKLGLLHLGIWTPITAAGVTVLHRAELVRYPVSLVAISVFLAGVVALRQL